MAFERTLQMINEEMVFLEREATLTDSSLKRIAEVLRDNQSVNLEQIVGTNVHEVMAAYIALNTNMTYEDVYGAFKGLDADTEVNLIRSIMEVVDLEKKNKDSLLQRVTIANKKSKIKPEDYQRISRIYLNGPDVFKKAIEMWSLLLEIKDVWNNFESAVEYDQEIRALIKLTGKNKNSIRREFFNDNYPVDDIFKFYRDMYEICDAKKRKERTINRNANKRIGDYNSFTNLLSSNRLMQARTFDECLSYLNRIEMQEVFATEYQDYIKEKHQVLQDKYNTLVDSGDTRLKALFIDLGLDFYELDENIRKYIISLNFEDVNSICEEIRRLKINDVNSYAYLIINSSIDIVKRLADEVLRGTISLGFLHEHLNLFAKEKDEGLYFKHYLRIVTLLQEKNINLKLFENNSEIYAVDIELVNKNLNILDNYNLLGSLKTCETTSFFEATDLEYRLDALLELGFERVIIDHLDILKYPYERIKRLYAYKSIGEVISTYEDLLYVLEAKEPIVPDNDLDDYISNIVDIEVDRELREGYTFSEVSNEEKSLTVNVNGLLFSRNRVLRNRAYLEDKELTKEEKEYYAFIMNGIYSYEELQVLKNEFKEGNNKRMI